jgi:tetratricopeptide (TPR) repeat protein
LNKDNLLFTIIGLLIGFLAGYMLQEALAARQPARRMAGDVAAAPQEAAAPSPGGAPGMPAAGGAPEMEAIQRLRERVEANPKDAEAVLELANSNFQIGRWDRARDLYTQYLGLRPANPDVLSDLGVTHRELGQFDRALDLFRQAQKMDEAHWQSIYNEVVVLAFDLKQWGRAEEALSRLRKMQPANPDVERLAGEVDRQKKASA